jgi:recombination protein RecR
MRQQPHASYPEALETLMELLRGVPGVGKRSSERMALAMLRWDDGKLETLSDTLRDLKRRVTPCPDCGNLSSDGLKCAVCSSPLRDPSSLCVVEEASEIRAMESSCGFRGLYHVLGGRLAPLEGKMPDSLNVERLERRLDSGEVKEIIFALSSGVEGQATAVYIANRLKGRGLKLSSLACGLPAGSDLTYADAATLSAALRGRTPFN